MNEADNQEKSAFLESASVNSTCANQADSSALDLLKEKMPTQTLHFSNSHLLNQANKMEEVTECQKSLLSYKERLYSAETTLTQQSQELAAAQEQVSCLLQELEAYHQKVQHQQILAESLTAQLQSSQEHVAQLERECCFTQSNYNQQSHQLMQTENACQELRARLARQQSHTLQLKLALEKSPDASVLSHQAQPIQPWSVQPQMMDELELDGNPSPSPLPPTVNSQETYEVREVPAVQEQSICEFLEDSSADQNAHLQNLVDMLETEAESAASPAIQTLDTSSEPVTAHTTQWSVEGGSDGVPESPQQKTSFFTQDTNWPSPVVYPSRPPRGRKSLAAIELPTFAQQTLPV